MAESQPVTKQGTIKNARAGEYHDFMKETAEKGICTFCEINPDRNPKIREGEHWWVTHNAFPPAGHQSMVLFVPHDHIVQIGGLQKITAEMWAELQEHIQWAEEEFNAPGGAVAMRFGDPEYNAGTMHHFHVHMIVPDRTRFSIFVLYKDEALTKFLEEQNAKK